MQLDDVGDVVTALADHGYLADEGLATAIFLALRLGRPLLLEGEAGVGKTEVAKVVARWTGGELIRLQCYEGIDSTQAVYEWDYPRQLLQLRAAEATGATGESTDQLTDQLFSERFLVRRPLLQAISGTADGIRPVLLIDEVDRADDEFEAFLLEILSDYAVTVPELGTFRAEVPPVVVITSNRTRDVHDALKRRCLYHWVEHPDFEREVAIVRLRGPGGARAPGPSGGGGDRVVPHGRHVQAARRGRDHRLGPGSRRARTRRARRGIRLGHARQRPEVPGGPATGPPRRVGTAGRDGEAAGRRRDRSATLLVGFVRALRDAGLPEPVGSTVAFVEAVGALAGEPRALDLLGRPRHARVPPRGHRHLRPGVRHVLACGAGQPGRRARRDGHHRARRRRGRRTRSRSGDDQDETDRDHVLAVRFSPHEVLRQKDFAAYDASRARRGPADHGRAAPERGSPPQPPSSLVVAPRRGHPDLRRTVREALRTQGDAVRLRHLEHHQRPRRVVLLCDVSGSMEPYSRALLRFANAAVAGRARVEAFTLGTRLTRLTRELSSRDPDVALAAAGRCGGGLVGRHPPRRGHFGASTTPGASGAWPGARWW